MAYRTKRQIYDELKAQNGVIERTCLFAGLSIDKDVPEDIRQLYYENQAIMKELMPKVWGGSLYLAKGMGGVDLR